MIEICNMEEIVHVSEKEIHKIIFDLKTTGITYEWQVSRLNLGVSRVMSRIISRIKKNDPSIKPYGLALDSDGGFVYCIVDLNNPEFSLTNIETRAKEYTSQIF